MLNSISVDSKFREVLVSGLFVFEALGLTVAQFLPIKSVYIVATGRVPQFFPPSLISQGPIVAALFLIAVAGLTLLLAKISQKLVPVFDRVVVSPAAHPFQPLPGGGLIFSHPVNRSFRVELALIILFGVIVTAASWAFFIGNFLYVVVLLTLAFLQSSGRAWKGKFPTKADSVLEKLSDLIRGGSTWSTVLLAFVSAVILPSPFGVTGILVAVVFGRRLQLAISTVVSHLVKVPASERNAFSGRGKFLLRADASTSRAVSPFELLSREDGEKLLQERLQDLGLEYASFRVVGQASTQEVIFLSGFGDDNPQKIVKIFDQKQASLRDQQVHIGKLELPTSDYFFGNPNPISITGWPALVIDLSASGDRIDTLEPPPLEAVVRWQIGFEKVSSENPKVTQSGPVLGVDDFLNRLRLQLRKTSFLPGIPADSYSQLTGLFPAIESRLKLIELGWIPHRPLIPSSFLKTRAGRLLYLGGTDWGFGRSGNSWMGGQIYKDACQELHATSKKGSARAAAKIMFSELRTLSNVIESGDYFRSNFLVLEQVQSLTESGNEDLI